MSAPVDIMLEAIGAAGLLLGLLGGYVGARLRARLPPNEHFEFVNRDEMGAVPRDIYASRERPGRYMILVHGQRRVGASPGTDTGKDDESNA